MMPTDDVSALARLREKLAGMTPNWRVAPNSKSRGSVDIDGDGWHALARVVVEIDGKPDAQGEANAEGLCASVSIARFVADEGTIAKVTQMVEQSVWSPASGPVSWTDEKIEAAREQAAYLARAILALIASAGEEA